MILGREIQTTTQGHGGIKMESEMIVFKASARVGDSAIIVVERKLPKGTPHEEIRRLVKPTMLLCLAEADKLPQIEINPI